ncbi:MAG: hypothetical protein KAJ46_04580, partial [Sedimentisphaerales bacterium]|nr:hypothetical protein [Sedimentisphaerales bacterium]
DRFRPSGLVNIVYNHIQKPGQKPSPSLDLTLVDVDACYVGFPIPLKNISGQAHWNRRHISFTIDRAQTPDGRIKLEGEINNQQKSNQQIDCRGEFNDLLLDERFVHYLPDKAGKLYRQLNLNGRTDGDFQFVHKADGNAAQASGLWNKDDLWNRLKYKIKFNLRDGRMKYDKFPYPLRDVSAQCELTDSQLRIDSIKGRNGETAIELSGIIREHNELELRLDCCDLTMDEQLVRALPESVREYYKRVEPSGMMNLDLKIIRRRDENRKRDKSRNGRWSFQGRADLNDAHLRKPLLVENITGVIQGKADYDEQTRQFTFSAEMLPAAFRVMDHPLADTTCTIDYNGEQKKLIFDRIGGDFCDGRLAGRLAINIDPNRPGYELAMQFLDGDLAKLLVRSRGPQKKHLVKGDFSGFFNLSQSQSQQAADRRGHFNFIVTEAAFGELPFIAQLLHVINLKLPGRGAFNEAEIMGDILGDRIILGPVHLRGSAVSLTGAGFMQGPFFASGRDYVPGESTVTQTSLGACPLEMILFVDAPRYLPEIPVLSSFYQAIRGELMQVRVSGSFDNPQVESVAFPTLGDALRYLEEGNKTNTTKK